MKKILVILVLVTLLILFVITIQNQKNVLDGVPIEQETSLGNPDFEVPKEWSEHLEIDLAREEYIRYAHLQQGQKKKLLLGVNTPCTDYQIESGNRGNDILEINIVEYSTSESCIAMQVPKFILYTFQEESEDVLVNVRNNDGLERATLPFSSKE